MIKPDEKTTSQPPINKKKLFLLTALVIMLGVIVAYWIVLHQGTWPVVPQDQIPLAKAENTRLEQRLEALENQIRNLETQLWDKASNQTLADFEKRMEDTAQLNKELLENKANSAALLTLMMRMESLEAQIKENNTPNSQGALVLTAALMVKESADKGRPFVYEAEVLRLLAEGTKMQSAAEKMTRYAAEGLPSIQALIISFNEIYKNQKQTTQTEGKAQSQGWKEKLSAGLNKLITFNHSTQENPEKQNALDPVFELVNAVRLDEALEKMQQNPKYATKEFLDWQKTLKARQDFITALQNIKSLTLAQIKAESLNALSQ